MHRGRYFEEDEAEGVTARGEGLGCRCGLKSHQFVRMSPGLRVDCHIHPHQHEGERLAKCFWHESGANVFFKRTGACLPVALLKDDVVGRLFVNHLYGARLYPGMTLKYSNRSPYVRQ